LESLDQTRFKNLFCVTLYKFLLATGCRINEALALNWSDIDLENAVVHVTKTLNLKQKINSPKSKSSYRDIDIDPQTVTMLKQYKHKQTKEAWKIGKSETVVFSNIIDKYSSYKSLEVALKKHFTNAGVPIIGFHGFRHTHASLLLNAGIPYKELQHRLGHSTLSMTMDTYSHLSKESAKKAVSIFETALNNVKSS
jgi:integrase/recombinase, phage integrase family